MQSQSAFMLNPLFVESAEFALAIPNHPGYLPFTADLTRKSIEATAKYFIWALFVLFLFVVIQVLKMMGIL